MENYSRNIINLLKEYISNREMNKKVINNAQKELSIELDRRKVNNEPTDEMQSLYDDILWLKCDILKY